MSKQVENEKARVTLNTNFVYGVVLFQRGDQPSHTIYVDVSKMTKESIMNNALHGIKQRIADATAMPSGTTRDERIKAAQAAADALENNVVRERGGSFDERQTLAITIYTAKKHGGKLPKGGRTAVWGEIQAMPAKKGEAFWAHVDAMMNEDADW